MIKTMPRKFYMSCAQPKVITSAGPVLCSSVLVSVSRLRHSRWNSVTAVGVHGLPSTLPQSLFSKVRSQEKRSTSPRSSRRRRRIPSRVAELLRGSSRRPTTLSPGRASFHRLSSSASTSMSTASGVKRNPASPRPSRLTFAVVDKMSSGTASRDRGSSNGSSGSAGPDHHPRAPSTSPRATTSLFPRRYGPTSKPSTAKMDPGDPNRPGPSPRDPLPSRSSPGGSAARLLSSDGRHPTSPSTSVPCSKLNDDGGPAMLASHRLPASVHHRAARITSRKTSSLSASTMIFPIPPPRSTMPLLSHRRRLLSSILFSSRIFLR